ncbi:MAG: ankyrin repeat domain-containing protein, partial [Deltaproteobacteria bacterium]|nr:ankyrin repeat domain-containing protein [Deltaproteobacteria bacterium]
ALEFQQHLSNLLFYYIPAFSAGPERQALGIYVPELHALLSRIMAMGAFGSSPRLNRHTPMGTIRKIEDAVFYPGAQSKLFAAVKQNDAKRVTEVIQGGAYVDGWDDKGHTPLHHAALAGHTESAIALIQRGADVNLSPHPKRETALRTAMSKRHWKTAAALVANGASLDTGIHRTWLENAMCATSKSGDIESLRIFLDAGINPDITQTNGVTPLMCAANGNQPETAKLLIRAGADVNARASHNRSALRYAQSGRFHKLAEILKNAGARE